MSQLIHYQSNDQTPHCLHSFTCEETESDQVKPVILLFPAMGVKASYYFKLAQHFNPLGIHFVCTDLRGNDPMQSKPSRKNNFGYHEMIQEDWPAAIAACKKAHPNSPIYLMGHSLGGQLSACYATHKPDIQGMILIACGNLHYKLYNKKWRILLASQFLLGVTNVLGYLPGNKLGFAGIEAKGVIQDWAYTARTGFYRSINQGTKEIYNGKMGQVKTPIMAISFDGDKFAPHSSMQGLLDCFHSSPKHHIKTCAQELNLDSLDHFNWTKNFQALAPKIEKWINSHDKR